MNSSRAEERIRAHVLETPLVMSGGLGTSGTRLLLKLENRQDTGSFKLRGATNKLLTLPREQASRGVVAASSGNHALGVATIGGKFALRACITNFRTTRADIDETLEIIRDAANTVMNDAG